MTSGSPCPRTAAVVAVDLDLGLVEILDYLAVEDCGRMVNPLIVAGQIIGGKTGTSQDFRDAWFVGMTPDLVVGIWVGNDDDSPMNRMFGGEMPAGIFHDFVQRAAEKLAKGPSFALEVTKDALNREASMDLVSALEAEAQIQAALMVHPDFREAYEAFVEKRDPNFQ